MRVKCRVDGELPFGRKEQMVLAVHGPHPAAKRIGDRAEKFCPGFRLSPLWFERSAKEVIFYEEISNFVYLFLW